jgi:hypothetical protein
VLRRVRFPTREGADFAGGDADKDSALDKEPVEGAELDVDDAEVKGQDGLDLHSSVILTEAGPYNLWLVISPSSDTAWGAYTI